MNNCAHNDFSKLEIPVVIKLFIIYEMTHKLVFKFPKHERYSLGEKIEKTILNAMELLIFANQISKYKIKKLKKYQSQITSYFKRNRGRDEPPNRYPERQDHPHSQRAGHRSDPKTR